MLKTRHSFFNLGEMDIPTADWEEYFDDSQFEEGTGYLIGVLKQKEDKKYIAEQEVHTLKEQIECVREMRRKYGSRSTIIMQEMIDYKETGTLLIDGEDYNMSGDVSIEDRMEMDRWAEVLSENFLFVKGEAITIIWGKDCMGRLLVRGIY